MENGLPDIRNFRPNHIQTFEALPSEIHALRISDNCKTLELPVSARNGCSFDHLPLHPSQGRPVDLNDAPSTEFKFIDECTSSSSSSSSACSTTKRDPQNSGLGSGSTCHLSEPARSPTSSFPSSIAAQVSTALSGHSPPSKHLPSAVVIGYQRAIAESIAAAGLMTQKRPGPASSNAEESRPVEERTMLDLSETRPNLTSGSVNKKVDCSPSAHRSDLLPPPPPPPPPEESDDPTPPSSPRLEDHFETGHGATTTTTTAANSLPVYDQHMLWEMLVSRRGSTVSADDAESIAESVYHQPPKAADRAAACRLAKRLFTLDGFKITDVAKHLCKRNDFSQLVGEEFASFFDFSEQPIDAALRSFLTKFSLTGESQERERVLFHFSRRYVSCNPGVFVSEDACHTLVCALMLLNTDLHNQNIPRKMTSQEFVNNLMELNHGGNGYCREELRRLYTAIKQDPLRWPQVENPAFNMVSLYSTGAPPPTPAMLPSSVGFAYNGPAGTLIYPATAAPTTPNGLPLLPGASPQQPVAPPPQFWTDPNALAAWAAQSSAPGGANRTALAVSLPNHLFTANGATLTGPFPALDGEVGRRLFQSTGYSPFVDLPKDITAKEYMRGFVMRKWVMESHGKKTSLGKRGWKAFYARLRDLVLYLYKDADTAAAATRAEEMHLAYLQQVYRVYYHYQQQQQHHQMQLRYQHERYQQQQQLQQQSTETAASPPDAGEMSTAVVNKRPTCLPLESFPTEEPMLGSCNANTATAFPSEPVLLNGSANTTTTTSPTDTADLDGESDKDLEVEVPSPADPGTVTTPTTSTITPSSSAPNSTTTAAAAAAVAKPSKSGAVSETNADSAASAAAQPPSLQPVNSYVFTVPPLPPSPPPPETVICIAHAFASTADDYTKKQHVFRLRTKDGAEFLFQVTDAKEVDFWVDKINYVAGLLSAPALPSAVGSGRGFNRPLLPSGITPLSVHEQLEEHQKRILDLTQDLAELRRRKLSAPSQPNLSYSRDFFVPKETPQTPASPKVAPASAAASLPPTSTPGVIARAQNDQSATVLDGQTSSERSADAPSVQSAAAQDAGSPLQTPPSPFIPDSVLKSLQSPSAATLPSSATNYSLSSAFSTASLGRRRKIFSGAVSSLMGGGDMSLAAQQRAEYEERLNHLESELARYKTYSRLLEAELFRLQRVAPSFAQQLYAHNSPQFLPAAFPPTPAGSAGHLMGAPQPLFQPRWVTPPGAAASQPVPPDLVEEPLTPSPTEPVAALSPESAFTVGDEQKPVPMVTAYYTSSPSLPPAPSGKRPYGPSSSPYVSMRQGSGSRLHRYRQMQFRHQRQQQQQYLNALVALKSSPALQHVPPSYQPQQLILSPHQVQSDRTFVPPTSSLVPEEVSAPGSENPGQPSQSSLYEVL